MASEPQAPNPVERASVVIWLAASAGAFACLLRLLAGFWLEPAAQGAHDSVGLQITSACALLATTIGSVICAHASARARGGWVARGGLRLNLFFALIILAQALPSWIAQLSD